MEGLLVIVYESITDKGLDLEGIKKNMVCDFKTYKVNLITR